MRAATQAWIDEAAKKGNAPVTLSVWHFPAPTGDVYVGSRAFSLGGHDYQPLVLEWSPFYKQVNPNPFSFDLSDGTVVISNAGAPKFSSWFAGIDPLRVSVDIYHWFDGLADADKLLYDTYVVKDVPAWNRVKVTVELVSLMSKRNKTIGTLITRSNYPSADPDFIGWIEPIIYGSPKNVVCPWTIAGGLTTTIDALNATDATSTFKVTCNTSEPAFPAAPFTAQAGDEQIRVTNKGADGKTWTGTRGYNGTTKVTHGAGAVIFEVRSDYTAIVSDRPLSSIGDVYILGSDGQKRRVISGFTKYPSSGGKAKIVFTSKVKFDKSVALAANSTEPGHVHSVGYARTTVYGSSASNSLPSGWTTVGVIGNVVDGLEDGTPFEINSAGSSSSEGTITVNWPAWTGPAPIAVKQFVKYFWYSSRQPPDSYTYLRLDGVALSLASPDYVTAMVSNGSSYPSSTTLKYKRFTTETYGLKVKEIWLVVETDSTSSANAGVTTTLGGNSAADHVVGGTVLCDAVSATYNPGSVISDVAQSYGGYTAGELDMAAAIASLTTAGYRFDFALYRQWDLKTLLARLAFQCRCRVYEDGGKLRLVYRTLAAGASQLSITKGMILKGGISAGMTPKDELLNDMEVKYNWDWSKGDPGGYDSKGWLSICNSSATYPAGGDAVSVGAVGKKDKQDWSVMEFVADDNTASANRDFYIGFYKARKNLYSLTGFSPLARVQRDDVIDVTHDDFGLAAAKFFVENVRYAPGSGKLGRGHQVELTLRAG